MHAETDSAIGAEISAHFHARLFIARPLRTGDLILEAVVFPIVTAAFPLVRHSPVLVRQ
jgi:hypothetical protein